MATTPTHPHRIGSPIVATYLRWLNIVLPEDRRPELTPYTGRLPETADPRDPARHYILADWLARAFVPEWLDATGAHGLAHRLRELSPVRAELTAKNALSELRSVAKAMGICGDLPDVETRRITAAQAYRSGIAAIEASRTAEGHGAHYQPPGGLRGAPAAGAVKVRAGDIVREIGWYLPSSRLVGPTLDRVAESAVDLLDPLIAGIPRDAAVRGA